MLNFFDFDVVFVSISLVFWYIIGGLCGGMFDLVVDDMFVDGGIVVFC